jgi:hypothetical protein
VTPRPSTPDIAIPGRWPENGPKSARESTRVEIDAGYATLDDRDRARVDERGEAGEHARVAEVGMHPDALQREPGDEELLVREHVVRPGALAARLDDPAGGRDALRERRRLQDDDHALAERDARPGADEAAPAAGARRW